ncbi:MAG TPA: hypothetical protein VGD56_19750 [Gemmatirosa sp.]
MADDMTPGEASIRRGGPQMNIQEARAVANEAGTVRGEAPHDTADRDVLETGPRANVATSNLGAAGGASGGTGNQQRNERPPDDRPFTDSETALGGADAVQKTTWGVGHGTEPDGTQEYAPVGLKKGEGPVVARVGSGGGLSPIALAIIALAVLVGLVYAFGLFR